MLHKLKTKDTLLFGLNLHIPYADPQVIEIDAEGNFEANFATEEDVKSLLKSINHFYDPLADQTEDNDLGKSEDDKNNLGGKEKEDQDELIKSLDKYNMPDLKQMAEDSGFPIEQWEALTKPQLKVYLIEKIKSSPAI